MTRQTDIFLVTLLDETGQELMFSEHDYLPYADSKAKVLRALYPQYRVVISRSQKVED